MMLTLNNITFEINRGTALERSILKGIDLTLKHQEFVTIVGSNGAGKSTLLSIIAGDQMASGGKIDIDGIDVTALSAHQRANCLARVFQDPLIGSCGDLTIAENMALAHRRGKRTGLGRAVPSRLRQEFQEALRPLNLGLETRLDTRMNQLSGGQRQTVSLVMAALSPAKVLLLDEHTSALDPKTAETVMQLTDLLIREKKMTALMVTHSLTQAARYGHRTIVLHEGRVTRELVGAERSNMTVQELWPD